MAHSTKLLQEIVAFLKVADMGETYFGLKAANNPHLVSRLRDGRRVWPETEDRVRAYIKNRQALLHADVGTDEINRSCLPQNVGTITVTQQDPGKDFPENTTGRGVT